LKLLLWGINYSPESTGIAPFNRELCEYIILNGKNGRRMQGDFIVLNGFAG
jgi:hypothetical protein